MCTVINMTSSTTPTGHSDKTHPLIAGPSRHLWEELKKEGAECTPALGHSFQVSINPESPGTALTPTMSISSTISQIHFWVFFLTKTIFCATLQAWLPQPLHWPPSATLSRKWLIAPLHLLHSTLDFFKPSPTLCFQPSRLASFLSPFRHPF